MDNNKKIEDSIDSQTGYKSIVALESIKTEDSEEAMYQIAVMMDKNQLSYEEMYAMKAIF